MMIHKAMESAQFFALEEGKMHCKLQPYTPSVEFLHTVINIPESKVGCLLPPNNIGRLHLYTSKSFNVIVSIFKKIHKDFSPFLWLHIDPLDQNIFTITCLHMSYKIYIYADIESDMFIVEIINVNMIENIVNNVYTQLQLKLC